MDAAKFAAYMVLWSVGFIAIRAITASPMNSLQSMIAGNKSVGV